MSIVRKMRRAAAKKNHDRWFAISKKTNQKHDDDRKFSYNRRVAKRRAKAGRATTVQRRLLRRLPKCK